jgi:hypothetical protein
VHLVSVIDPDHMQAGGPDSSEESSDSSIESDSIGSDEDDFTLENCPASPEDGDFSFMEEPRIPHWLPALPEKFKVDDTVESDAESSESLSDGHSDSTSVSSDSTTSSTTACECTLCTGKQNDQEKLCLRLGTHVLANPVGLGGNQEICSTLQWWVLARTNGLQNACTAGNRTDGPAKNRWMGTPRLHTTERPVVLQRGQVLDLNSSKAAVIVFLGTGNSITAAAEDANVHTTAVPDISFIDCADAQLEIANVTASDISITWPRDSSTLKSEATGRSACANVPVPICIRRNNGFQSSQCAFGAGGQYGSGWTSTSQPTASYVPAVLAELGLTSLVQMQPTACHILSHVGCFTGITEWLVVTACCTTSILVKCTHTVACH